MNRGSDGMLLQELLLVMAVLLVLGVVGAGGLFTLLEQYARGQAREQAQFEIRGLGVRLQRVMDQRTEHLFSLQPAVVMEGEDLPGGLNLGKISVRTLGTDGTPGEWQLVREDGGWREIPPGGGEGRLLAYGGRIHVNLSEDRDADGLQYWTFTDAAFQEAEEGFAIHGNW